MYKLKYLNHFPESLKVQKMFHLKNLLCLWYKRFWSIKSFHNCSAIPSSKIRFSLLRNDVNKSVANVPFHFVLRGMLVV